MRYLTNAAESGRQDSNLRPLDPGPLPTPERGLDVCGLLVFNVSLDVLTDNLGLIQTQIGNSWGNKLLIEG